MKPFFSIITVTKNTEKKINLTVASVLSQSFKNFEYIIVDGYSSDSTFVKINRYSKNKKIKIYRRRDKNFYDGLNFAISKAKGNYISILNSGDIYFSKSILKNIYKNILAQSIEFIWLRPFYLYGKHQHPNALINHLYNKISTGQEIELKNPNQAHDFIYINDLISIIKIIEISKIKNEVFNVGSGTSVSVTEVANSIKSLFGKDRVTNSILEETAIADINKAKEMLKWSPKYSIETGIQEFVEEKKND